MSVVRGFTITITSSLVFGLLGAGLGSLLGLVVPDYYRAVLRIPPEVAIDPVQAGLGLGITQGLAAGLLVGLVIVASVAWHTSRSGAPN